MIDTAETIQDSERFSSHDHGLLVVRVGYEMYINGQPIIWNEDGDRKSHLDKRRTSNDVPYENKNRRLLKLFENYIADLAVRESFKDMGAE